MYWESRRNGIRDRINLSSAGNDRPLSKKKKERKKEKEKETVPHIISLCSLMRFIVRKERVIL